MRVPMRWFWIDRFVEFTGGQRAVAVKNITLSEPHVSDYWPGSDYLPTSLMIEGFAQTGGILVAESGGFRHRVVLAKVSEARISANPRAGQTVRYTTILEQFNADGAFVTGTAHVEGECIGQVKLVFAHLSDHFDAELFQPGQLLQMLQQWRFFDVARQADGTPSPLPEALLADPLEVKTAQPFV